MPVARELGAIRTLMIKLEAQLNNTRKRKQDDRRGKQGNVHAAYAQGKTHKGQKGKTAQGAAPVMPATYMSSSASEHEEEVHFANYAQAWDPFPIFTRVESIVGPFVRKVVHSAKPDQSRA